VYEIDHVKFGAFIANLRKENKWTQKQLAEKLFVSDKAVSKWERGLSLPDISLLVPLTEQLGISLTELIQCQKSATADPLPLNTVEDVVTGSLSLSKQTIQKQKRHRKILIAVCAFCVLLATVFAVTFYVNCIAAYPDPLPLRITTGYTQDGDVSQWQELFPHHSAYDLGLNTAGKPVFKNPSAALHQIITDCSDAIAAIQKQHHLLPISRFTVQEYGTYGWQVETENSEVQEQGQMLTDFLDIYENSFQ